MKKHLRSLDGLRALSIAFVIYSHLSEANEIPKPFRMTSVGFEGVLIFFVLSGYLITSNLSKEKEETGTIDLRSFALQRAFRILPASLVLIACSTILAFMGYVRLSVSDVFHAATYTMDYHLPSFGTLGHLWSLSIEEQF